MKIAVIGAGYDGLVTAVCIAEIGHLISAGNDGAKFETLERNKVPIHKQCVPEPLARLSYLDATGHEIASPIHGQKFIVVKSKVPVRACEAYRKRKYFSSMPNG